MPDTTRDRVLVLLRHAKAVSDVTPDVDRPLSARGHADAAAVGRWLVEGDHDFGVVLCSPSSRTRETWAELEEAGVPAVEVSYDPRIYDASMDDLLDTLADVPDDVTQVLVVGHAPGIPTLADHLADPERSDADAMHALQRSFPTSCFAVLALDHGWADLVEDGAELTEVAAPRG